MSDPAVTPAPDLAALQVQVARVARLRQARDAMTKRLDDATALFLDSWQEVVDARKATIEQLTVAECDLKDSALAHYAATGERKPFQGVEVKVKSVLSYDTAEALAWAKSTTLALVPESLDVKAFEKLAKATALPFVTVHDRPQAQIARDLSAVLPDPKDS